MLESSVARIGFPSLASCLPLHLLLQSRSPCCGLGNTCPKAPLPVCTPAAWQQVEQQLDGSQSGESTCGPVQYVEKTPNPGLKSKWGAVVALGASG